MKNSGAPDIGDIVQHKQDLSNNIKCIFLIKVVFLSLKNLIKIGLI